MGKKKCIQQKKDDTQELNTLKIHEDMKKDIYKLVTMGEKNVYMRRINKLLEQKLIKHSQKQHIKIKEMERAKSNINEKACNYIRTATTTTTTTTTTISPKTSTSKKYQSRR